jgi:hypothetical protein
VKSKKKIVTISIFGFSFVCLAFALLVSSDIIIFKYSIPSYQEKIKLEIFYVFFTLGIVPPLILYMITGRRRKVKRRAFTKITKEQVLRRQNYRCNVCRISSEHWDFDHIGSRGTTLLKIVKHFV